MARRGKSVPVGCTRILQKNSGGGKLNFSGRGSEQEEPAPFLFAGFKTATPSAPVNLADAQTIMIDFARLDIFRSVKRGGRNDRNAGIVGGLPRDKARHREQFQHFEA